MDTLPTILTAVAAVFGVMGVGFLLRRINWLSEQADRSLLRVVVNVLLPCFIFEIISDNESLRQVDRVVLASAMGFGFVATGIGLAGLTARLAGARLGLDNDAKRRTFALAVGLQNYGYVPLPLAMTLFDSDAVVGLLLLHNMGVELALWTIGVWTISGGGKAGEHWLRRLASPPLIAIMVSLSVNFLDWGEHTPAFLKNGIGMLGACAIPMGLLLAGATVADFLGRAKLTQHLETMLGACALRQGVMPLIMLAVAWAAPISTELKQVIVIQAAMSSAVFPIILSKHYNGDPPTAVRVALGTTGVGLITIPLWLHWGLAWLR